MSQTIMFIPLHPVTGAGDMLASDEFVEELTRHGIVLQELDDGGNYYALELPEHGDYGNIEEDVFIHVQNDKVHGVSITEPQSEGKAFWFLLLQMGYILREGDDKTWYVSADWATQYNKAGRPLAGVDQFHVIKRASDFEQYSF